ncbi:MAG: hypothetical protein BWY80_01128 [Firmicutes bacterium ADurb.Bin456]|nr:MAG: hypothetical protein BWY80_01128 [Firmicutes bacterium ADurb.Bin456]
MKNYKISRKVNRLKIRKIIPNIQLANGYNYLTYHVKVTLGLDAIKIYPNKLVERGGLLIP